MTGQDSSPIRIGISACLLGEKVRYDGGHKRDAYLVETLGRFVQWVPVCPEIEMGLGTPRETLRLVRLGGGVRMVMPKTGANYTDAMQDFAGRRIRELAKEDLSGYILKKGSPSCGMERVRVFDAHGVPVKSGRGLFAEALLRYFPDLPVEEEGRLCDRALRENFIERVFAYHRLQTLFAKRWTYGDLVAFHTAHKLLLMAHSPPGLRQSGTPRGTRQGAGPYRIAVALHGGVRERAHRDRHPTAPNQRPRAHRRLFSVATGRRLAPRTAHLDRGLPPRPGSTHRPHHADPATRSPPRHSVSPRSDLPGPSPQRTHAEEPCVRTGRRSDFDEPQSHVLRGSADIGSASRPL